MKLRTDEKMVENRVTRFIANVEGVAAGLEEQAAKIRRDASKLTIQSPLEELLKVTADVVHTVNWGHAHLNLDHRLLNQLVDVVEMHDAVEGSK